MTHPNDPIERALRASLEQHAREAPPADLLAERIIHAADRNSAGLRTSRRSWRTWGLPLIAAGAVGAVVAAVIGIEDVHTGPSHPQAGHSVSPPVHHTTAQPTGTPVPTPTATTVPSTQTTTAVSVGGLHHVQILDLTFVGPNDGWALSSADCIGKPGRCTAFLRTTDGMTWNSMPGPAFNVAGVRNCAAPCVQHMRFANDQIGYAYGPHALFMTKDGGLHWTPEKGLGADALETLSGNVIRVSSAHSGCPGPCDVRITTAPLGSPAWTPVSMPGNLSITSGVALARTGNSAFLQVVLDANAGGKWSSTFYVSTDNGASWAAHPDPCPAKAGTWYSAQGMTTGADGSVSLLCAGAATSSGKQVILTSRDSWSSFAVGAAFGIGQSGAVSGLATPNASTALVLGDDGVYRSTNGGTSWTRVIEDPSLSNNSNDDQWCGFETGQIGRCVSGDGNTLWTTRDAGASWTAVTFG
ncbi:MAG TPA: hypothetical protein VFL65_00250 [Jatrophihabitans sp.]|nr:hypothetical protein [Jatrophihabitans sp.]